MYYVLILAWVFFSLRESPTHYKKKGVRDVRFVPTLPRVRALPASIHKHNLAQTDCTPSLEKASSTKYCETPNTPDISSSKHELITQLQGGVKSQTEEEYLHTKNQNMLIEKFHKQAITPDIPEKKYQNHMDIMVSNTKFKDKSLRGTVVGIIKLPLINSLPVKPIVVAKIFPCWCIAAHRLNITINLIIVIEPEWRIITARLYSEEK